MSTRCAILLLLTLLAVACDDSDSPVLPGNTLAQRLVGDYTAHTDSLGGFTYWIRFGSDGTHALLTERDNGIRTIARGEWTVVNEDSALVQVGGSNRIASLSRSDSVLTLSREDSSESIAYTRSEGMPDPESWVIAIQLLEEFEAPDAVPTDLSWDGTGLWFPGRVLNFPLQRLNTAMNLQIDSSLSVSHTGSAVAYTPDGFWVDDWIERRLYQLQLETGETRLATRFVAPTDIHGLSTMPDGTVCISAGQVIYLLDTTEGDMDSVDLLQPVEGLENIGSAIYAALGAGGIARVEGPPWHAETTYVLHDFDVHGIAFDGADWWLYVIDRRTSIAARIVRAKLGLLPASRPIRFSATARPFGSHFRGAAS